VVSVIGTTAAAAANGGWLNSQKVGRQADGSIVTPTGQRLTPAGQQAEFTGRPVDVAIRPDGKTSTFLTAQGSMLAVLDVASHRVLQTYGVPGASASFAGIAYSPDGTQLYASSSTGKIVRASVGVDGTITAAHTIALNGGKNANPYPGGLAPSADGRTLYVALSQDNALGVVDLGAEKLTTEIPVGNAPHAVVLGGGKAYVTDQGGRPAVPGDFTNDSARTALVANRQTGGVATGAVSVVDVAAGKTISTIPTGLQPTGAVLHDGALFVANSLDDTISVIDTRTDRTVQTIDVQPLPKVPLGSEPNGVTFAGKDTLAISLGRNNAVALYKWKGADKPAAFQGLIPTGWYPTAVALDSAHNRLLVANGKGVGSLGPTDSNGGHRVQALIGSASSVPLPDENALKNYTGQVLTNDNLSASREQDHPRRNAAPTPVPARIGEPSTIKHVFYIIKENRTYDQVFGDTGRGNSDPRLTMFGQQVTPNQHALVQRFPLLDNYYASGDVSADGHQWSVQANVPDYLEKAFGGFVRSYPYNGGDAMAYTKSGFLWDNALAHKKSVSIFGEYANQFTAPNGSWLDWYHDYQVMSGQKTGTLHAPPGSFKESSDNPTVDKLLQRNYSPDQLGIPDQHRVQMFKQQFDGWVKQNNLPNLVVTHVNEDHTAAAARDLPTPRAMVADNDLAVGKMVDWISHSQYWKDSAIFITEDDAQNGVDHVDGHRTTGYVISPWTKQGNVVDSHYGSQVNMVRTIEQILGLPPMNQMDMAATPMRDLFTSTPNFAPFNALANQVPLDEMNPGSTVQPASGGSPAATAAAASMTPMQKLWADASDSMKFTDPSTPPDQTDWNLLNHAIWYATKGYDTPYPGDQKVLTPSEASSQHDGVQPGKQEADGDK
jgi:YVTN family beta-propeller protein